MYNETKVNKMTRIHKTKYTRVEWQRIFAQAVRYCAELRRTGKIGPHEYRECISRQLKARE